jgi:hypothetical protein
MTPVRSPGTILCERVDPPQRVYVRTLGARKGCEEFVGEVTHRATLAGMVLGLSVRMEGTGVHVACEPHWVRPYIDMAALFDLPTTPQAEA